MFFIFGVEVFVSMIQQDGSPVLFLDPLRAGAFSIFGLVIVANNGL